jgi:hypothetical protein
VTTLATEYTFEGSANVSVEELRSFMAAVTGGFITDNYVRSDFLDITPLEVEPGDESPIGALLGFVDRISIVFRISNRADSHQRDEAVVLMVRTVLQLFDRYPSEGVLLFNGEQVVLQRLNGRVVVDSKWEELADIPELAALVAALEVAPLPQPLL